MQRRYCRPFSAFVRSSKPPSDNGSQQEPLRVHHARQLFQNCTTRKGNKNEKRRSSVRKRPTHKLLKALGRTEGLRQLPSATEGELAKNALASTSFVAESGRMLGRRHEKMAIFEQDDFDLELFADAHMMNLSEKGIGTLRGELATLQEKVEKEAQGAIHGSYSLFVHACDGVSEVDSQFQHLRVLVAGTASLASELKRVIQTAASRPTPDPEGIPTVLSKELSIAANGTTISVLEELDMAIAERDFPVAKKLLLESDKELEEIAVDARRQTIVQLIESALQDPTLGVQDKRSLLQTLSSVAGDVHGLNFLLTLYSGQIANDIQQLPRPHRTGESETEGADYSGNLSQCCCHGIGLAVEDFRSVFGGSAGAPLCSILSQWADNEAKTCAEAIQSNALSSFAGLSAVVSCVAMSLVYAQALRHSHAINIIPAIRSVFWPTIEGLIDRFFASMGEDVLSMIEDEVSDLTKTSYLWDKQASPSDRLLLDSSQMFVDRLRYLCSMLRPLWTMHIGASLRTGLQTHLMQYIERLATDVKEAATDVTSTSIIDRLSEWLMTVLANLIENQIPKELSPLEFKSQSILSKRDITRIVDAAAELFGMESV